MYRASLVTFGCQMNEADSQMVKQLLLDRGFDIVPDAASADLVVVNTCTVRRRAEEKAFGALDYLKGLKRARPRMVVGVIGCMVASSRDAIEARAPHVDFALVPHQLDELARIVQIRFPERIDGATGSDMDPAECPWRAYVNIMTGCDNHCTFCIVPAVRGREVYFAPAAVERQVGRAVAGGVREITLLGQNVNSYRYEGTDFADLLGTLAAAFPSVRFRFTSPHPKDFSQRLIDRMARTPNVCRQVHLPLQSGSDRVLRLMKRSYTRSRYMGIVAKLREALPGLALSTDIICGFPGETEEDFERTLDTVRTVRFDQAFMFYYSERPGTQAISLADQIPVAVRKARLRRLIDLQIEQASRINDLEVGRIHRCLVEKPRDRLGLGCVGRTDTNKLVVFPGDESLLGRMVDVKITRADALTLFGETVGEPDRLAPATAAAPAPAENPERPGLAGARLPILGAP